MVRHHLVMDCSSHEGLSDRSRKYSTLLYKYSVDSVEMDALFVPDL